ncbi:hypothetical protein [Rhodopirellula bahusiensis]|uniref:hypothetical protein n=1 Tax=Rhodopirellula bahusiensis TaxID=2014065 RepID=UPI0032636E23
MTLIAAVVATFSLVEVFATDPLGSTDEVNANPRNVSIIETDGFFAITVDSSTCGTGDFLVLCYFTDNGNNCLVAEAGISSGDVAKVTSTIDVKSPQVKIAHHWQISNFKRGSTCRHRSPAPQTRFRELNQVAHLHSRVIRGGVMQPSFAELSQYGVA